MPIYTLVSPDTATLGQCEGLHGHVKVGPDGTAYVPNAACVGPVNPKENGFALSEDNGTTWKVRTIPEPPAAAAILPWPSTMAVCCTSGL